MSEPQIVELLEVVDGVATGVTIPGSPGAWEETDVVLVQLALLPLKFAEPDVGYVLGDVSVPAGWNQLPPQVALVKDVGPVAVYRWWVRPSVADLGEPQAFAWPQERPFSIGMTGFRGLRQLGDPLGFDPTVSYWMPSQVERDIAAAIEAGRQSAAVRRGVQGDVRRSATRADRVDGRDVPSRIGAG